MIDVWFFRFDEIYSEASIFHAARTNKEYVYILYMDHTYYPYVLIDDVSSYIVSITPFRYIVK